MPHSPCGQLLAAAAAAPYLRENRVPSAADVVRPQDTETWELQEGKRGEGAGEASCSGQPRTNLRGARHPKILRAATALGWGANGPSLWVLSCSYLCP